MAKPSPIAEQIHFRRKGKVMKLVLRLATCAALLSAFAGLDANASTAPGGWYLGKWSCQLDGRPTRMEWKIVSVDYGQDNGDGTATSVAGAELRGRLWDRNGPWATLTRIGGSTSTLSFRHADGNRWFLRRGGGNTASGYSTWQGTRYPFDCRRRA